MSYAFVADYLNESAGFVVVSPVSTGEPFGATPEVGMVAEILGYADRAGYPVPDRRKAAFAVCRLPTGQTLHLWNVAAPMDVVFH
jgi:hypothetical protein